MQDNSIIYNFQEAPTGTGNNFSKSNNLPELSQNQDQVKEWLSPIGLTLQDAINLRIIQTGNGNIKIYQQQNNGRIHKDRTGNKDSYVLRISDHNRKPDHPKYINPKSEIAQTKARPNLEVIRQTNSGKYNDRLDLFEGTRKALASENAAFGCNGKFGYNPFSPGNKQILEFVIEQQPKIITFYLDNDDYTPKRDENNISRFSAQNSTSISDNLKDVVKKWYGFLNSIGLKNTKIIIKLQNHLKGFDDLKEAFLYNNNIEEWRKIVNSNDEDDARYFTTIKLKRTAFETQIDDLFATGSFEQYYNRYKSIILDSACLFKRITYKKIEPGTTNKDIFQKVSNLDQKPIFAASIKDWFQDQDKQTKVIKVEKYVSEDMEKPDSQIVKTYNQNDIILKQSGTGTGKTSTNIEFFIKNKIPFILAVPLQSIAKQQEQHKELTSIIGGQNFNGKSIPNYIVCPYDSIHKIPDKERRVLIFDEAHNLFNLWGNPEKGIQFRAKALRKALNQFKDFKKVILLSATMPVHLQYILEKIYPEKSLAKIEVQRLQSNAIHLNIIDTKESQLDFLKFQKLNPIKPGNIGFLQYNNIEQAHRLKDELVSNEILKENQILLINKRDLEDEKVKDVFRQITRKSEIQSDQEEPLLIIATCIIGEGININNSNIQYLAFMDNRSAQDFIQVGARFRQANDLDVFLFTDASKKPDSYNKLDHKFSIDKNIKKALLDLDEIEHNLKEFINELPVDITPFSSEILEADTTRDILPDDFDFIYLDELNRPHIDYPKIGCLHQRQYDEASDLALFLGDILKAGNVFINGYFNIDQNLTSGIELKTAIIESDQDKIIQNLQNKIAENPSEPIKALHYFYKQSNQPDKQKRIELYCPDLAPEMIAATTPPEFYKENETLFKTTRYFKNAIRCYIFLRTMGAPIPEILETLNEFKKEKRYNHKGEELLNEFEAKKTLWQHLMALKTFKDANQRRKIANLKTRNNIKKLQDLFKLIYTFKDKPTRFLAIYKAYYEQCKLKRKTPDYKPDKVYQIVCSIFDTDIQKSYSGNIVTVKGLKENPFQELPNGNDFRTFLTYLN